MKKTRNLFLLISVVLIATFLWRAFTPSHEAPSYALNLMTMGFDLLCLVGLIGCWIKLSPEFRANAASRMLCVAAVIAGVGLFAIRLHNGASWNTGHYHSYLDFEPRSR